MRRPSDRSSSSGSKPRKGDAHAPMHPARSAPQPRDGPALTRPSLLAHESLLAASSMVHVRAPNAPAARKAQSDADVEVTPFDHLQRRIELSELRRAMHPMTYQARVRSEAEAAAAAAFDRSGLAPHPPATVRPSSAAAISATIRRFQHRLERPPTQPDTEPEAMLFIPPKNVGDRNVLFLPPGADELRVATQAMHISPDMSIAIHSAPAAAPSNLAQPAPRQAARSPSPQPFHPPSPPPVLPARDNADWLKAHQHPVPRTPDRSASPGDHVAAMEPVLRLSDLQPAAPDIVRMDESSDDLTLSNSDASVASNADLHPDPATAASHASTDAAPPDKDAWIMRPPPGFQAPEPAPAEPRTYSALEIRVSPASPLAASDYALTTTFGHAGATTESVPFQLWQSDIVVPKHRLTTRPPALFRGQVSGASNAQLFDSDGDGDDDYEVLDLDASDDDDNDDADPFDAQAAKPAGARPKTAGNARAPPTADASQKSSAQLDRASAMSWGAMDAPLSPESAPSLPVSPQRGARFDAAAQRESEHVTTHELQRRGTTYPAAAPIDADSDDEDAGASDADTDASGELDASSPAEQGGQRVTFAAGLRDKSPARDSHNRRGTTFPAKAPLDDDDDDDEDDEEESVGAAHVAFAAASIAPQPPRESPNRRGTAFPAKPTPAADNSDDAESGGELEDIAARARHGETQPSSDRRQDALLPWKQSRLNDGADDDFRDMFGDPLDQVRVLHDGARSLAAGFNGRQRQRCSVVSIAGRNAGWRCSRRCLESRHRPSADWS